MKRLKFSLLLLIVLVSPSFSASPFSEEAFEVKAGLSSNSDEAEKEVDAGDDQVVDGSEVAEPRPEPDALEAEIEAYFKTLDLMSRYPEQMQKYLQVVDGIEKELASKLFNEIDYGVATMHQRKMDGQPVDDLMESKYWTQNWIEKLNQVVIASRQFKNVALNHEEPTSEISGSDQVESGSSQSSAADQSSEENAESGEEGSTTDDSSGAVEEKPVLPIISERGRLQMERVVKYALDHHRGGSNGFCFNAVWGFLSKSGYGNIKAWGDLPRMKSGLARYFADFMNASSANLNEAGLQRLDSMLKPPITNPHDERIPVGAVIVVAAGSTGTSDPYAGDIVVKGNGRFINDGPNMWYGEPDTWRGKLLGVYIPK